MDATDIFKIVGGGASGGIMVSLLWLKGFIVLRRDHDAAMAEKDKQIATWQHMALHSLANNEKVVTTNERLINTAMVAAAKEQS